MKTNRTHSKGGQSKAVPQGQTAKPSPKVPRQASHYLRLIWCKGEPGYTICLGADADAELHAAGLMLKDLEPDLGALGKTLLKGRAIEVDYRYFIRAHVRAREVKQLTALLGLNAKEAKALGLICHYLVQSPLALAREGLLGMMNGTFDEMTGWVRAGLGHSHSPESTAWAKEFHPRLKALCPKGGWK